MKNFTLFLMLIFSFTTLFAQIGSSNGLKLRFKYDAAGNQTTRYLEEVRVSKKDINVTSDVTNLYPNPTHGYFKIYLDKDILQNAENINIFDISGRIIKQVRITDNSIYEINISGQPRGIYLINIYLTDNRIITKKIIKQ